MGLSLRGDVLYVQGDTLLSGSPQKTLLGELSGTTVLLVLVLLHLSAQELNVDVQVVLCFDDVVVGEFLEPDSVHLHLLFHQSVASPEADHEIWMSPPLVVMLIGVVSLLVSYQNNNLLVPATPVSL